MKTILIVLIALTIFFAGCASTPTNETTTTTMAGGKNTETTRAAGQTAGAEPAVATVTTIVNYKDDLMTLYNKVKDYVVSYDVTAQRGNNTLTSSQVTFYIEGNNTRLDTSVSRGAKTIESRYFLIDNQFMSCSDANGQWSCSQVKTVKLLTDARQTIQDNIKTSSITQLADRVVLGTNAKCYHLVMDLANADPAAARQIVADGMQNWEGTYCGTNDGVMLYYTSMNKNVTVTMEATNYHLGTGSSDFTLPATPIDPSGSADDQSYGPDA